MTTIVRPYTPDDYDSLHAVQRACFPPPFPESLLWSRRQIESHCRVFPAGALCVEADGTIVGSATAHIIRFDPLHPGHTWADASADGMLTNHDTVGDTLYGVDIAVTPAWRRHGIARLLYEARYALVRRLGLRRFLAGSRISGYRAHAATFSPEAYCAEVIAGRLTDPVITPQLRSGLRPMGVVPDYLPDHDSCDCALLMAWENPERP
jgi:GNAT superfamily N-acetyltransferase